MVLRKIKGRVRALRRLKADRDVVSCDDVETVEFFVVLNLGGVHDDAFFPIRPRWPDCSNLVIESGEVPCFGDPDTALPALSSARVKKVNDQS